MFDSLKNILFSGVLSIFNSTEKRNTYLNGLNMSDKEAIMSDWINVGNDIRWGMIAYGAGNTPN